MNTPLLNKVATIALAAFCAVSCNTPVEKVYPTEVTIENYSEFEDAPQSVIDALDEKERQAMRQRTATGDPTAAAPKCTGGPNFGQVTAWNGSSWTGIQNVKVTQANWFASTNAWGNYALCASTTGPVCMAYTTSETNGVSGLDIIHIRRHILNIAPFDNMSDGVRRYVAADVNHDGLIDDNDVTAIQQTILAVSPLPGNNMTFVPNVDMDFAVVTDPYGLSFLQNNCRNNASYHMTRRAIKMGDVSGNFSF